MNCYDWNDSSRDGMDEYDDEEEHREDRDLSFSRTEYDFLADQVSLATLVPTTTTAGSASEDENYDEGLEIEHNVERNQVPRKEYDFLAHQVSLASLVPTTTVHEIKLRVERDPQVENRSVDVEVQAISLPAEKGEVLSDKISTSKPLAVLCMQGGLPILRFSEIFGDTRYASWNEKEQKRGHNRHNKSLNVSCVIVEEDDEEAFIKGFQSLTLAHSKVKQDMSKSSFNDDDLDYAKLKDSRFIDEPMKRDQTENLSVESERESLLSSNFYPLDLQDWEDGIIWGDSPLVTDTSAGSCEIPLRDSSGLFEPFGSRNSPVPFSESRSHPQLLRLHMKNAGENNQQSEGVMRLIRRLSSQNRDMLEESWLDQIIWDPDIPPTEKPRLILDLQDEQMLFKILDNKDTDHEHLWLVTRPANSGHRGGQFGWQDVANDEHYSMEKTSQQLKSDSEKRTAPVRKKPAAGRGGSNVAGTDADSRRLTKKAAQEVLHKLGVSDELIAKKTKVNLIAMIQKLSSENYSKGNNKDLDFFVDDLENLLETEESDEGVGVGGNGESKRDKPDTDKGLKKRKHSSEEECEDEAVELCRLLMDDDETVGKQALGTSFEGQGRPEQKTIGAPQPGGSSASKENPIGDAKAVDSLPNRNKTGKLKGVMKNNAAATHTSLMNKKVKISIDGVEVLKEEKPVRESFKCTACSQFGHMRTNKKCPKYTCGKDLHKASGKSTSLNPSSWSLPKTRTNKVTPESSASKISVVEASRVENLDSSPKVPKLKFTCRSNKVKPESAPVESHCKPRSVIQFPSDTGGGCGVESQKTSVVTQSPANADRDQVELSQNQQLPIEAQKEQHQYRTKFKIKLATQF